MKKNLYIYILLITMLFSCKPQENFNYMKNIEDIAVNTSLQKSQNTIQVGDQLVIMVTAKDMDVVKPFNQNYSSSEVVQPNQPGGNTGMVASQTAPIYVVDDQGDIDFPVIGKINTVGKTTTELKDILRNKVAHYVINPTVSLRLTNFKITVLGEVNRQETTLFLMVTLHFSMP
jgi:polysaccharide export outer membrane protein